jgi:hypothetical protein
MKVGWHFENKKAITPLKTFFFSFQVKSFKNWSFDVVAFVAIDYFYKIYIINSDYIYMPVN